MAISTKHCLICKRPNETLHWHIDKDTGEIWVWCNGTCQRGYGIHDYCNKAGVSLKDFLKGNFDFKESQPNTVTKMEWPTSFIPLSDPRAKKGVEYLQKRGLNTSHDFYYDMNYEGIVFPMYFSSVFVGSQTRLLTPWINQDGEETKITTLPGTRTGLLFWGYNGETIMTHIKGLIVTEGALNAASIQQALNTLYGGFIRNPWKVIAASGSGASQHQREELKKLKDKGYKIICASDNDQAGLKCFKKYVEFGSLTHYAFCDTKADWNDELQRLGDIEFAKYFLSRVKPV